LGDVREKKRVRNQKKRWLKVPLVFCCVVNPPPKEKQQKNPGVGGGEKTPLVGEQFARKKNVPITNPFGNEKKKNKKRQGGEKKKNAKKKKVVAPPPPRPKQLVGTQKGGRKNFWGVLWGGGDLGAYNTENGVYTQKNPQKKKKTNGREKKQKVKTKGVFFTLGTTQRHPKKGQNETKQKKKKKNPKNPPTTGKPKQKTMTQKKKKEKKGCGGSLTTKKTPKHSGLERWKVQQEKTPDGRVTLGQTGEKQKTKRH